ncbi:polysaccharide lyase family 1 protein [Streptomyces sp. NPDC058451]|uniref:pectate lyase family protein n=1 Tax=Streptomyces sp. NPDC058451 TaxID=3346506 RepID=UPI0036592ABE
MRTSKCHARVIATTVGCAALVLAVTGTTSAAAAPKAADPARQVLAAKDGWASYGTGTTGGATADAAHTYTVTTWDGFKAALAAGGSAPKVIKVKGMVDADGPSCSAFEVPGYDFGAYLETYSPQAWGRERNLDGEPDNSPEGLRRASAALQDKYIKANIPANTTIVGVGKDAGFKGASFQIKNVDNVIVRNLTLESPLDCFPQWDPTDTADGNWNSEYDSAVITGSTHVWMDHNTFTDGEHPNSTLPYYYGRIFEQHDGELDIVKGADYVTVSWNVFEDHDKTILIGNSDSASTAAIDRGHLKVTLHHNLFRNLIERAPRVRFGQVDSYNNHYVAETGFGYSLGIGMESQLVAEHNAFTLARGVGAGQILKKWKDSPVTESHNYVNGRLTDLIAVHNAQVPDEILQRGGDWTPALRTRIDNPKALPGIVDHQAGAGRLH